MKMLRIYDSMLLEDFKTQKKRFIQQGIGPDIVNSYIEKFKHIKNKKYKEIKADIAGVSVDVNRRVDIDAYKDFHELERVVDYVGGQRNVSSSMGGTELEVSGKPIYEDNAFEVYYADSPRACVEYKGKIPYSWCISRSDSNNMFYTYRFKPYEPAFYFVKDKKAAEKEFKAWNMTKNVFKGKFSNKYHFFVLQVPKNINPEDNDAKQYIVSSANNDGDTQMSWNEIVALNPKIKSIKEVLEPKPFTPEERKQHTRFREGINDREFSKLTYEEKKDYLDIYPSIGRAISYEQLKALPDDLMNLYVSFGIGLDGDQHNFVVQHKPKILKRYISITHRKYDEYMNKDGYNRNQLQLNYSEIRTLTDDKITTYLQTLGNQSLNELVHDNEDMTFEFVKKHLPEKFDKEDESIIELVKTIDNEESLTKLNEMIPNDSGIVIGASRDGRFIKFNVDRYNPENHKSWEKFELEEELTSLFHDLSFVGGYGNYYEGYYFDGNEEELEREYEEVIKNLVTNDLDNAERFLSIGLKWDEKTVKDILATYKKDETINDYIDEEFNSAESNAKETATNKIAEKIHRIIELDDEEITVSARAFIMFIHNNEFFDDSTEIFAMNIAHMITELLSDYGLPTEYYELDEMVRDEAYEHIDVDYDDIHRNAKRELGNALELYADDNIEDESGDEDTSSTKLARLKSEVINQLKSTLNSMGEDPNAESIENDIVKIGIDRSKFKLSGEVYITLLPRIEDDRYSWDKRKSGYVKISDLPTHFNNYKLFETMQRFKDLI